MQNVNLRPIDERSECRGRAYTDMTERVRTSKGEALYLTNEEKREKIKEIIKGIAMAINAMCQITSNYEEYSRLTTELKNQLDWQASMVGAKREGRAETSLEIARKMKTAGRPLSEIEEFTGLPPETIERM